jgi:hypothetical protein
LICAFATKHPDEKSETNTDSLNDARRGWPKALVARLETVPLSTFDVPLRDDEIGGYDYIVDGIVLRDMFRAARGLKASIRPWSPQGDGFAPVGTGLSVTPTGRTRLYVCAVCGGDDYEASLTADLQVSRDRVIWSRIGLESYDDQREGWNLNLRSGPAGFAFDAHEYRRVLRERFEGSEDRSLSYGAFGRHER